MMGEHITSLVGMQFQRATTLKLQQTDLRKMNYSLLIIMCLQELILPNK